MNVRFFVTVFLISSAFAAAAQRPGGWVPPAQPVYAVVRNSTFEGPAPTDAKLGDLLMVQIFPEMPSSAGDREPVERKRLYEKDKVVALFVDAERRGEVRIEAVKEYHCNSAAALVRPTVGEVPLEFAGLATNAAGIPSRPGSRRDATESERSFALQLATREFLRNKVASTLMARINIYALTAIEVDGSKENTIVGSFFVQTKTERHDVFLIARASGPQLSLEFAQYRQTTDLEDFKDHVIIDFLDHLDLNHDGIDEIVLCVRGYEGESYEIYARRAGRWERVATSGNAGC